MSLYHKYRPNTLEEIIGNAEITDILKKMFNSYTGDISHAFLLHGPTGTGKTTLARIIANQLGSFGADLQEVDIADYRGIDTIREIRKQAQYKPIQSSCRVWIMDEFQKASPDAMAAMLKILEDTPPHVYFILCTTDPQKLLPTIKGRCTQFQTSLLTDQQMMQLLRTVVKAENENLEKLVYEQIIQDSLGHPRNALQILDQVLRVESEKRADTARMSAEQQSQSIELCRTLLNQSSTWGKYSGILNGLKGQEAESIRRHILGYCQAVLLKGVNDRAALCLETFEKPLYDIGFPGLVLNCYIVYKG